MITFVEFYRKHQDSGTLRVIVSVNQVQLDRIGAQVIEESKKETVGRHTAYKHQPHIQGGEYHGHSDLPGGHQLSWTLTGKRLHPNKFPADDKIPNDAKIAVAKVLGISANLLEAYMAYDEVEGEEVLLIEAKKETKAARFLKYLSSIE